MQDKALVGIKKLIRQPQSRCVEKLTNVNMTLFTSREVSQSIVIFMIFVRMRGIKHNKVYRNHPLNTFAENKQKNTLFEENKMIYSQTR